MLVEDEAKNIVVAVFHQKILIESVQVLPKNLSCRSQVGFTETTTCCILRRDLSLNAFQKSMFGLHNGQVM